VTISETQSVGRREQTKSRNREAILVAAKQVFASKGYEATTVRDIIRSTELASGTFYNYFKSKDEIAAALASDVALRLRPILRDQRERATDFESYLNGIVHAYFQYLMDEHANKGKGRRKVFRPLVTQAATPAQRAVFEEIRSALAETLGSELADGCDVEFITASIIGIARNVGLQMLYRVPQDPAAAARFVVDLILRGISGMPRNDQAAQAWPPCAV
jgi:AcrR family transcriptional regulator